MRYNFYMTIIFIGHDNVTNMRIHCIRTQTHTHTHSSSRVHHYRRHSHRNTIHSNCKSHANTLSSLFSTLRVYSSHGCADILDIHAYETHTLSHIHKHSTHGTNSTNILCLVERNLYRSALINGRFTPVV